MRLITQIIIIVLLLCYQIGLSQSQKGIAFQAAARTSNGVIMPNKQIQIRISILKDTLAEEILYQELKSVTTSPLGLFTILIGAAEPAKIITIGAFENINWTAATYFMRVEIDPENHLQFIRIGQQQIQYAAYAFAADHVLAENVKGILSLGNYETDEDKKNHRGSVFKMIVSDLEKCGYNVHTKLFKLKWYDIPQNRERVIFIGVRNDISERIRFDWPVEKKVITKTLKDAIGDLPIDYDEELQHIGSKQKVYINGYMGNRKLDWDKISPTITGRGGGTGGPCINVHPSGERRMTIREYARIQTFPDSFKFEGSKSSMYRQIGNAVPPKFSFILSNIINALNKQL